MSSCDKDFNSIGGDLVGDEHFGLEQKTFNVLSYNQKVGPVQSNNLPVNPLGVYEDPIFGTTEASFVTQVVLASVNPTISLANNPVVESVVLNIPYFSHADLDVPIAENGATTYVLESIYGPENGRIKLSVYESGYYLRDLDPTTGFLEPQKYYTNQGADFVNLIKSVRLNDSVPVSQNDQFLFDSSEIRKKTTVDGVETTEKISDPAMRLALNKAYFQQKIIDAVTSGSGKLVTNDVFKDYFRGLYFKVEKAAGVPGRLAMMNFKKGTITINYKENSATDNTVKVQRSIVLNLTGNTVSLLSNNLSNAPGYSSATTNPNTTSGDDKLYLKGGEGAMAVLDLFDKTDVLGYDDNGVLTGPNLIPDELDELRRKDPVSGKRVLINEANLVFHVDGPTMDTNELPNRMYLYDLNNHRPILDYVADDVTSDLPVYGGILNPTKIDDKTYKFRITNHVRNLINNKDSTNVKLGVVVTENITNSTMNKLRLPLQPGTTLTKAPQASVMSPLGVVLYGGTASVPETKKLKLEIYYTKPN